MVGIKNKVKFALASSLLTLMLALGTLAGVGATGTGGLCALTIGTQPAANAVQAEVTGETKLIGATAQTVQLPLPPP